MKSPGLATNTRVIIAVAVAIVFVLLHPAQSDARYAVPWSPWSNSPRSVAMGSCGVNVISPETPIYSPGALGIYALDNVLAVALPNKTNFESNCRYQTWGAIAAPTYKLGKPDSTTQFRISVGLAYSRIRWDWGPPIAETLKVFDQVNCVSGALGVEIRKFIRFGVGYTHRRISSHLRYVTRSEMDGMPIQTTSASKVYDYGFVGQLNLHSLIPHKLYLDHSRKYFLHAEVNPSYGYVKSNVGKDMRYFDSLSYDPLIRVVSKGPAIATAIKVNESSLLSFFWCKETQKMDYGETTPYGVELGIGGTLFLRKGDDFNKRGIGYKGEGIGVSLRGVTSLLNTFGVFDRIHGTFGEFVRRLDVSFDFAMRTYVDPNASEVPGIKYYKVTISFAN